MFVVNELVVPNLGLADTRKQRLMAQKGKKVKPAETHILYFIVFSLVAYSAFLFILINQCELAYSPLHCYTHKESNKFLCEYEKVSIKTQVWDELVYLFAMIFGLGPLRVFLKVKEGKTSVEEILEDYEDDRTAFHSTLMN